MILIDAEALLYWLEEVSAQEKAVLKIECENEDPFLEGVLSAIHQIKSYVKAMPTFEPEEKVIAKIESPFDEKTFSKIIKDLLAEHEATQEHEHDYFLAGVSSVIHSNHYKHATLVCRKCGATKGIEIKG